MLAIGGAVAAALLALAWFDGGEEPLRPIAQDVALPDPGPVAEPVSGPEAAQ